MVLDSENPGTAPKAPGETASPVVGIQSEAELTEAILQAAGVVIVVLDHEGRIVRFNPAAENITGYGFQELKGEQIWKWLIPPEVTEKVRGVFENLMHDRLVGRFENEWLVKGGGRRLFSWRNTILRDRNGQVSHVVAIGEDITERRQTELALENYKKQLEELVAQRTVELGDTQFALDRVGLGVHWVDSDTARFLYVNNYAASMLGYTVEEMLKLSVFDIDPNFPRENFKAAAKELFASGTAYFETIQQTKDGKLIPVEIVGYALPANAERKGRFITFITNATERKLLEKNLRDSKEAAEHATLAKSAFLANMSHEIRTPLNGILGMAYLMRRDGLTPAQEKRMGILQASSEHLLTVINDILDISKIEAGKFDLKENNVNVAGIVDNISSMLHEQILAKNLELHTEIGPMPDHLVGDASRIQQALLNYAGNAVKFTATGRISIRAHMVREDEAGVVIRFEVQDTGIGIAPEVMPKLFTAFEQGDTSSTRKYGGTGLGLAITQKIAHLMQGEVGAESILGKGSTFWLSVRVRNGGATQTVIGSRLHAEADAESILKRDYRGVRILLAEDEPANREIARDLLSELGLIIDIAEDGVIALERAQESDYAAILMDVQMPHMNGLDATRQIRQLPRHKQTPILAMTANAFDEDKERCFAAGMSDFVGKPFVVKSLYSILLAWLSQGRPH